MYPFEGKKKKKTKDNTDRETDDKVKRTRIRALGRNKPKTWFPTL
jgi:hypothetical protein